MGKLLITSGGYLDGQRGEELDVRISELCTTKRVLIVDNATLTGSNAKGVLNIQNNFSKIAKSADILTLTEDNVERIKEYDVIYFTGGDMAPLAEIVTDKIKNSLIHFLSNDGVIIGESAGSIIFSADFKWYYEVKKGTKPKYNIELPSYKGFGFIGYTLYPHWNKAKDDQKQKVRDYAKEHGIDIVEMKDGQWKEEIFLNNNIEIL